MCTHYSTLPFAAVSFTPQPLSSYLSHTYLLSILACTPEHIAYLKHNATLPIVFPTCIFISLFGWPCRTTMWALYISYAMFYLHLTLIFSPSLSDWILLFLSIINFSPALPSSPYTLFDLSIIFWFYRCTSHLNFLPQPVCVYLLFVLFDVTPYPKLIQIVLSQS